MSLSWPFWDLDYTEILGEGPETAGKDWHHSCESAESTQRYTQSACCLLVICKLLVRKGTEVTLVLTIGICGHRITVWPGNVTLPLANHFEERGLPLSFCFMCIDYLPTRAVKGQIKGQEGKTIFLILRPFVRWSNNVQSHIAAC